MKAAPNSFFKTSFFNRPEFNIQTETNHKLFTSVERETTWGLIINANIWYNQTKQLDIKHRIQIAVKEIDVSL